MVRFTYSFRAVFVTLWGNLLDKPVLVPGMGNLPIMVDVNVGDLEILELGPYWALLKTHYISFLV